MTIKPYKSILYGLILICILFAGCYKKISKTTIINNTCQKNQKPITIVVHGTLPPLIDKLVHAIDCPLNLTQVNRLNYKLVHGRLAQILNDEDPIQFPLDAFYLFGWSGKLSFEEREQAAQKLYEQLRNLKGDITLIGHSHGCNVILNLAKIAEDNNDYDFKIERIILLACPVQKVTAKYVKSNIFKKIYSLYSESDFIQIIDPQGVYKQTKDVIANDEHVFFSERIFPYAPNIIQAHILMGSCNPGHREFIFGSFIRNLPDILNVLDKHIESKEWDQKPVTINIPAHYKKPHIVKAKKSYSLNSIFTN